MPVQGSSPLPLRFTCKTCHTVLTIPVSQAGVSGPCPNCSAWVDASEVSLGPPPSVPPSPPASFQPTTAPRSRRPDSVTSGRGRIRADGHLDHSHQERKEFAGTLKLIVTVVAVAGIILSVFIWMK